MANTFKNYSTSIAAGTNGSFGTVPADTTSTCIGLTVANTGSTTATISVELYDSSATAYYYIVKNAPVPMGGSMIVVGGEQKVVMETGDAIRVTTGSAASVDAIASVLEIS